MSRIFQDGQARRASKKKIHGRRRSRSRQSRWQEVRRFLGAGPAQGLKLSRDRDDPHFPGRWVLSFQDLVLSVSFTSLIEVWNRLTGEHQAICMADFEPTSLEAQDRRRRLDDMFFRAMNFWDRASRPGTRKHGRGPDIGPVAVIGGGRRDENLLKSD